MPGLPPDLAQNLAALPLAESCRQAGAWLSQSQAATVRTVDHRFGRYPRPGDPDPEATGDLAAWPQERSRPAVAKHLLDGARRMYLSSATKFRRLLLEVPQAQVPNLESGPVRQARNAVFNVLPQQPQTPTPGKVSALWLLYMAYRLVRDYEVNPHPPGYGH